MSFLNTVPASLRPQEDFSTWNRFHVGNPLERVDWLRRLCRADLPVSLGLPGGEVMTASLWSVDSMKNQLHFSAPLSEENQRTLQALAKPPGLWGAAYIADDKLQFRMSGLDYAAKGGFLNINCSLPIEMYRLTRRQRQRVKSSADAAPLAQLPLAQAPSGAVALLVLDVSMEGCALQMRQSDGVLRPGTNVQGVEFEFDELTFLVADLEVLHVTPDSRDPTLLRVGCRWVHMSKLAKQVLQRWTSRGNRPRELLSLDL